MPVIAGATVTFTDYSAPGTPRLLNIPDVWGDVTVEDLWDTLSEEAAKLENLVYKKLIDRPRGGGRGVLSATKSVGISLVGNNVQVKFADQPGPSWVIKRVVDGNFTAIDHLESGMEAISSSDFTNWKNEADTSAAGSQLTSADSANLTLINTLAGAFTFRKNVARPDFMFDMRGVDGQPLAGLTITGQRSQDSGALAALDNAGSITDLGSGLYSIDLTATDLNADMVYVTFTASGAIARTFTIATVAA